MQMRAAPGSWEWLVLGAVVYADLGLGMGLFLWFGQTQLQTAPTTEGQGLEGCMWGGACVLWERGPPPVAVRVAGRIKLDALLAGKRRKVGGKRL